MNTVYNVDCLEYMRTLPDKYFDWGIVDPPYGIGIQTMSYTKTGEKRARRKSAAKNRDYRNTAAWDIKPPKEYFDELFRVTKNQIIWGGNYFTDMLPPSKSFICWDKRCNDNARNDFADCELAWSSYGVARMIRYVWNGMLQGDMKNKEERFHPTQKPVALYAQLYSLYCKKGDKILDTHLGSGSSRIAAYDANLDFVGCEIDKEYFELQEERFAKHKSQMNLFVDFNKEKSEQIDLFES